MVGWHHRLDGHEFEETSGDSEGQESLACCSPRGCKESDTAYQLNDNKIFIRKQNHCYKIFVTRNIKGSSLGRRSMMPYGNLDLHKERQSTGNGTNGSKNEIYFFLSLIALKDNWPKEKNRSTVRYVYSITRL